MVVFHMQTDHNIIHYSVAITVAIYSQHSQNTSKSDRKQFSCRNKQFLIGSMEYQLFVLVAPLLWLCDCGSGEKISLNFSYITTKTGSFVSSGGIPAVDLALEQINNRTSILPNYTLNYTTILDSEV